MLLSSLRLGRRLPGLRHAFPLPRPRPSSLTLTPIPASRKMGFHAYAGNPLKDRGGSGGAADSLSSYLRGDGSGGSHKILPLRKGRPLARPEAEAEAAAPPSPPLWRLCWLSSGFTDFPADSFVYLGSNSPEYGGGGAHYWAFDANEEESLKLGINVEQGSNFVELRTLMVATDWTDERAMGELAIAGHAKALLEWHTSSRFCGHCGAATSPIDAGRRKECTNDSCKKRSYPRVDPVVIMLVVDKVNDRVLLSRQSRYVPRMWSCLAGFAEPGESLEEAVRRETWEETGIEVGEVVYHSSQPWPVGPSSMPCQLMVGFTAHAKSFDIRVDKKELEDAQWHSREAVTRALTFTEYAASRRTAALKVNDMFRGGDGRSQRSEAVTKISNAELAPMFVPGPYAIAHHLISSWVNQGSSDGPDSPSQNSTSFSSL